MAAVSGNIQPTAARTRSAKTLRRESRERSSLFALTFLCVAAMFLIGMVVVLILSLAG